MRPGGGNHGYVRHVAHEDLYSGVQHMPGLGILMADFNQWLQVGLWEAACPQHSTKSISSVQ